MIRKLSDLLHDEPPSEPKRLRSTSEVEYDVDDLNRRIAEASKVRDLEALPWLQLELQVATVALLTNIDWKMWEIYNKFVR